MVESLVEERALDLNHDIRYVGREGSIEQRIAAKENIAFVPLQVRGLRTLAPLSLANSLILMVRGVSRCRRIFNNFKPQVVLATGGYVSAPAIWVAARSSIPVLIYLPDLEPGWAIRLLSRWASRVAVSFDEVKAFFPPGKAVVTGYPVRADFYRATKSEGRSLFHLKDDEPVVTIFGGSQGAHSINEAVRENLEGMLTIAQVLHISGPQDEVMLQGHRGSLLEAKRGRYHLFGYLDREMPQALAAADLVIARAGAATIGEFPAVGVPSILVPYPYAGLHQKKNADFLVSHGAAIRLDDERLPVELMPTVSGLLSDKDRLNRMQHAARSLAHPKAAGIIAGLLVQAAG